MKTQTAEQTDIASSGGTPDNAPTTRQKRTRKPSAPKTGLVAKLQGQIREARKIEKATAIIAELSPFGITEVREAVEKRVHDLNAEPGAFKISD